MKLVSSVLALGVTVGAAEAALHGPGNATALPMAQPLSLALPQFTNDQCEQWIDDILVADTDGSDGLSRDEFTQYLNQTESYADLPWSFKVAYNALACWCHALGMGDGCCVGMGAEVPLVGLRGEDATQIQQEYKANVCDFFAAVFEKVTTPSPPVLEDPAPTAVPSAKAPLSGTLSPHPTTDYVAAATPSPTFLGDSVPTAVPSAKLPLSVTLSPYPITSTEAPTKNSTVPTTPTTEPPTSVEGTAYPSSQPSSKQSIDTFSLLPTAIPDSNPPTTTVNPGAEISDGDGSESEPEPEPSILGAALGIGLAAAIASLSAVYVCVSHRNKNREEDDPSLEHVRNQDLDDDLETGGQSTDTPGGQSTETESRTSSTGKDTGELIAANGGEEDMMEDDTKETERKQELIRELVIEADPGRSAESLIVAYDGREDELIKNLIKMKSKR